MKLIYLLGDVHGSSTLNWTRRIVLHTSYHYSCTRRLVCPPLSQNVSKWPQLVGGPTSLPPLFWRCSFGEEDVQKFKACLEHHCCIPHKSPPTGFVIKFSGEKNMAGRIYPAQLPSPASNTFLQSTKRSDSKDF
jgi:hypothetical protein